MRVLWFVKYGPDKSHLCEARHFNRLRDAKDFISSLDDSPTGDPRPFVLEKFEYLKDKVSGDVVKITPVKRRP